MSQHLWDNDRSRRGGLQPGGLNRITPAIVPFKEYVPCMAWTVLFDEEFRDWLMGQDEDSQDEVLATVPAIPGLGHGQ